MMPSGQAVSELAVSELPPSLLPPDVEPIYVFAERSFGDDLSVTIDATVTLSNWTTARASMTNFARTDQ